LTRLRQESIERFPLARPVEKPGREGL